MNKFMSIFVASMIVMSSVQPVYAAPARERPSILKYYLCLANPLVVDKTLCHM